MVPYQSASLGHTDAHIGASPSDERSVHLFALELDPKMDTFRSDPRYARVVARYAEQPSAASTVAAGHAVDQDIDRPSTEELSG